MGKILLLGLVLFLLLSSCQSNRDDLLKKLHDEPTKALANFQPRFDAPLSDRVMDAPPFLLKYLNEMDGSSRYSSHHMTNVEKALLAEYLSYLPPAIKKVMQSRLIGFYFIDNYTGGGLTDFALDGAGSFDLFIVLNAKILSESLSDWIAYRDNSPFNPGGPVTLENNLGGKYRGLLQTLLHESAHVYDYCEHATPFTSEAMLTLGFSKEDSRSFVDGVWLSYRKSRGQYDVAAGLELSFYGLGLTQPSGMAVDSYGKLATSPFTSLYGSQNWADDFAETFTWFWIKERLGVEYSVAIRKNGKVLSQFLPLRGTFPQQRYAAIKTLPGFK